MAVAASARFSFVPLVLALLASCTGAPHAGVPAATRSTPVVRTAVLTPPASPTTVLDAEPGVESAIATSATLFRSAPVVVVAGEGNRPAVVTGSAVAERLGVPMLLVPVTEGRAETGSALRRELTRLAPRAVLAVGADARGDVARQVDGVPVFDVDPVGDGATVPELPAGLPATERPGPVDVTVLVDAARADAAALASARAAGAHVVTVHGNDPRADRAAVEELHTSPPTTVLALGKDFGPPTRLRARLEVAAHAAQLPGGGQVVVPGRRLVCLYGHPGVSSLGVLGEQGLDASIRRAKALATTYERLSDVPVVPAFEIIVTVAQGGPGADGDYSKESSVESLRPWVERAGAAGLYVLLDLQPGRADLVAQAKRYAPLLRLPHVGLAVDPEWKLGPDQLPREQIGGVDAAEINRTTSWLAELTAGATLPQKLFVLHQFRLSMIRDEASVVTTHDELSMLVHMDGQGSAGQKASTWRSVVRARSGGVAMGWKNFYDEDHPMLTPEETMTYEPTPVVISYQ